MEGFVSTEATIVEFLGCDVDNQFTECMFRIRFPIPVEHSFLAGVREEVDAVISLGGAAGVYFSDGSRNNGSVDFGYTVMGRGKDNRCSWCRYFRKKPRSRIERDNGGFSQKNCCRFEDTPSDIYDS